MGQLLTQDRISRVVRNHFLHVFMQRPAETDIAILGKKGRGKTFTANGLVERLLQMQRRVLVLDPLSVWWGLKSGADGKSPGFPIPVFGGPHADIPLHDAAGPIIAELIVSTGTSPVLDMGQMRKASRPALLPIYWTTCLHITATRFG